MTRTRGTGALVVVAGLSAAILWLFGQLSAPRVQSAARAAQLGEVAAVLAGVRYDNQPTDSVLVVRDAERLGGDGLRRVFRAFDGGQPSAVVIETVAPGGYSGSIELLVGIRADGTLSGVRITRHRETRGLGDRIERENSDWVLGFDGKRLGDPQPDRWAVRRDGGDFDQFTGATITPRAVVEAVRDALLYFEREREALLAADNRAPP